MTDCGLTSVALGEKSKREESDDDQPGLQYVQKMDTQTQLERGSWTVRVAASAVGDVPGRCRGRAATKVEVEAVTPQRGQEGARGTERKWAATEL